MALADHDHEALLGRAALRVVGVLAVPVVGLAWLVRGPEGAVTAAGGLAVVGVGQFLTGTSLSWAARRGNGLLMAVTLGGFLVRLGVYAILIVTLSSSSRVDAPALVASVTLALAAVLTHETRLVMREGSFWWLDPTAGLPPAANTTTASAAVTAKDLA